MEERGAVRREDDGELGGEERKIFEEQLPDMWLWRAADGGGGVCKVFAVCRECTLLPLHTHFTAFSRGCTWIAIVLSYILLSGCSLCRDSSTWDPGYMQKILFSLDWVGLTAAGSWEAFCHLVQAVGFIDSWTARAGRGFSNRDLRGWGNSSAVECLVHPLLLKPSERECTSCRESCFHQNIDLKCGFTHPHSQLS